jgi:hypothetical protein
MSYLEAGFSKTPKHVACKVKKNQELCRLMEVFWVKRPGASKRQFAKQAKQIFHLFVTKYNTLVCKLLLLQAPEFQTVTCHVTFHVHFLLPL